MTNTSILLDNGLIRREIKISEGRISSTLLSITGHPENFISDSKEFSFLANDRLADGSTGWEFLSIDTFSSNGETDNGKKLTLKGREEFQSLEVEIFYTIFQGYPIIRKWIKLSNTGSSDIRIENLNVEDMQTVLSQDNVAVYHDYGRMKHLGCFVGDWNDPVIAIHEITKRRGIALGNEAPGVLKRTAFNTGKNNLEAGLTHNGQAFPFRKWLKKGESWTSPGIFICPYSDTGNGFDVINDTINEFVTEILRPRVTRLPEKPTFVYNTWYPFRTFIDEKLIRETAMAASECGIMEFVIDDGWQINIKGASSTQAWGNNYGDWEIDRTKFPNGLKPVFDYIRSLGMKPGLWISIGSATRDARVFNDHPEWFVRDSNGHQGNLHIANSFQPDFYTSCFGTDWYDYIKNVILRLVREYGLSYAKLDLSVVTSAYVNDSSVSGCYAENHPYHKDHRESFIVIYERVLKLFDELHDSAPDLFIDCTFETAGKLQLSDYAVAAHAEGNWLSNFEEPSPLGPLRVRQMAWWRSPALPASSLVIGNLPMDDVNFELGLKSLIGTLPIVLGDPRKLAPEKRTMMKKWSVWINEMQKKHNYMNYRKDLPGFGEPAEGSWDGWMRINTKTRSGGIFGVFRQGAREDTRRIFLRDIDPGKKYSVKTAPEGTEICRACGKKLMEEGFSISLPLMYGGNVYEVSEDM